MGNFFPLFNATRETFVPLFNIDPFFLKTLPSGLEELSDPLHSRAMDCTASGMKFSTFLNSVVLNKWLIAKFQTLHIEKHDLAASHIVTTKFQI